MDIRSIVDRINENSRLLSSGQISEIDRDILLADLRDLYTLVKGQPSMEKVVAPPVAEVKEVVIPIVEKKIAEVQPSVVVEAPVVAQVIAPEPVIVPVVEEVKELKIEVSPVVIEEVKEEPVQIVSKRIHYHEGVPVREPQRTSINEVFIGEERSINTVLATDKKKALNDRLSGNDLKSLIDLNKQHILTAELFHGDSAAFQSAISHINASPTIEAAFEYIKTELLPKYKWNGELQSTRLFDKLVRQKFGV